MQILLNLLSQRFGGTGLGLAITRKLERMIRRARTILVNKLLPWFRNPDALIGLERSLTKWGVMAVTRTKMEEFRRLAQECRVTALILSTEQARAEMLAMADVCDHVAAQPTNDTEVRKQGRWSD